MDQQQPEVQNVKVYSIFDQEQRLQDIERLLSEVESALQPMLDDQPQAGEANFGAAAEGFQQLKDRLAQAQQRAARQLTRSNQLLGVANEQLAQINSSLQAEVRQRKQAENELQESEQTVSDILASITDSYYVLDEDWRFTGINTQALNYFGRQREAIIGKCIWDVFPAGVGSAFEEQFRRAVREGTPVHFDTHSLLSDRWAEVHAYPTGAGLAVYFRDITERKRTEEALKQANQRLINVLGSVTEAYFAVDDEFRFLEVNPVAERIVFRKPASELIGNKFWDIFPQGIGSFFYHQYHRALAEGIDVHFEGRSQIVDRWFEAHAYPRDGRLEVYFRDISERKMAEERLAYQALLLENVHDAIVATDENFLITSWNRAAEELYGWVAGEVLGKPVGEVIRTSVSTEQRKEILRNLAEIGRYRIDLVHYTRDGRALHIETNSIALLGEDGRITGYVTANRDVTARKAMEAALRQARDELEQRVEERTSELAASNEALRQSEDRLRTVVNNAPLILWATDPQGRITLLEGKALETIGLRSGELVGRSIYDHLAKQAELQEYVKLALAGEAVSRVEVATVVEGEVFETHYIPYFDSTGQPQGMIGVATNITARVRADEALRVANEALEARVADRTEQLAARTAQLGQAIERLGNAYEQMARTNEELELAKLDLEYELAEHELAEQAMEIYALQLERSNRDLQDFASIASHDLQEPLRKIQAFGDRLLSWTSSKLTEEERDYLERMIQASARMSTMVRDLLAYSRVGTRARPNEPVELARVVAEVVSDLETRIASTGGRVEVGDLPVIEADRMQMRQLFQNLIGNALKFHRPGVPPVVRVSASHKSIGEKGNRGVGEETSYSPIPYSPVFVEVTVEDNGIGFEEKYVDRIFQPFQRLVGRSEYEGSGIGLAICRKIVERHAGSLTASSTPGEGTKFILRLPLRQPGEKPDRS